MFLTRAGLTACTALLFVLLYFTGTVVTEAALGSTQVTDMHRPGGLRQKKPYCYKQASVKHCSFTICFGLLFKPPKQTLHTGNRINNKTYYYNYSYNNYPNNCFYIINIFPVFRCSIYIIIMGLLSKLAPAILSIWIVRFALCHGSNFVDIIYRLLLGALLV